MVDVANIHLPVLLDDCVNLMAPALEHENAIAVDCTWALPAIPSPSSRPRLRLGSSALTVTVKRWGWPPNVWNGRGSPIDSFRCMPPSISSIRCWRTKTSNAWTPYSWIWDYPACRSTKPIVASPIRMMRRWICAWTSASR